MDIAKWVEKIISGPAGLNDFEKREGQYDGKTKEHRGAHFTIRCLGNPNCEGSIDVVNAIHNHRWKSIRGLTKFDIWTGSYDGALAPEHVGIEYSKSFDVACLQYELRTKLEFLERQSIVALEITNQDKEWWFNWRLVSNSWTGKYYQTKEEALKSFK